ncbi:MAG: leucyl aminopeptidase [Acidimicrobiales bacterium]
MPTLSLAASLPKSATVHDEPVASDELDDLSPDWAAAAKAAGFEGKVGQTLVLTGPADEPARVLVGIGPRDDVDTAALRGAAAGFVRAVGRHQSAATTLVDARGDVEFADAIEAVTLGLGLASYRYDSYKKAPEWLKLRRVAVVAKGAGAKRAMDDAKAIVEGVALARDLTNTPGGDLTPVEFVARARAAAGAAGVKVSAWDEKKIAREKLGGLLAVNKGSTHPPRFLVLRHAPARPKGSIALVGKGITFDSGGLSIKTGQGMMTMKVDMAGGAAVVGAICAIARLGLPVAVTAYVPLTDNMINGDATRPGDVFTARNGTTVEVLNTDAEGRLVLADALSIASEAKHDAIIDIATLTGAVSAALGTSLAGVMGTSDALTERVTDAASTAGESVWPLPLPQEYRSQLDSPIADVKNIGAGPYGGALTAGLFLKEFVAEGIPWAHIDLGLAAMSEKDVGLITKGGTGFGVRLLTQLVRDWESLAD